MIFASRFEIVHKVLQHGSFTKAAEALDISPAAVSQQVKKLEDELKLLLFHRTTRSVTPTEIGARLGAALDQSRSLLDGVLQDFADAQDVPSGRLRLNVPMSFGEMFLRRPIAAYAKQHPDVVVDVDFDDRRVNLIEDGYDLVVRIGALQDSGLVARKVGDCPILLCASPDFLARHGTPHKPRDISALPSVVYANAPDGAAWSCRSTAGRITHVPLKPAFYANSAGMMLDACLAGIGLALLPAFSCTAELAAGRLVQVLPDHATDPERGIYAVYPDRRYLPMKTRAFIDLLNADLAG